MTGPALHSQLTPAKLGLMDVTEICRLYEDGLSSRRIAQRLNVSRMCVLGVLHMKWFDDVPRLTAEGTWEWTRPAVRARLKILDSEIAQIFKLRAEGWSHGRIAKQFCVTRGHIGRILAGFRREATQSLASLGRSVAATPD